MIKNFDNNLNIENNKLYSAIPLSPQSNTQAVRITRVGTTALSNIQHSASSSGDMEHYLPTEEEMAAYSLLDKLPDSGIRQFLLNNAESYGANNLDFNSLLRLVANTLTGGLMTGGSEKTQLDGLAILSSNMKFFDAYHQQMKILADTSHLSDSERRVLKKVVNGFEQLKNYCGDLRTIKDASDYGDLIIKTAQKYAQKINDLNIGDAQLFIGGWGNSNIGDGHAQIYEITKTHAGYFEVIIHSSTGDGLIDVVQTDDKLKYKPCVIYRNVPAELLLFQSSDKKECGASFIQAIIELQTLAYKDREKQIDEKEVLRVFDLLERYRVQVTPIADCGLITGQRGGTCVPSSTKAWIRRCVGDLALYRQIMFHYKLRTLVASYQMFKTHHLTADDIHGDARRRVLKAAAHKLLRRVAKYVDSTGKLPALINTELAMQARATAHQLLNIIEKCDQDIQQARKKIHEPAQLKEIDQTKQRNNRNLIDSVYIQPSMSEEEQKSIKLFTIHQQDIQNAHNLPAFLKEYINSTLCSVNTFDLKILQIYDIIRQLPIPKVSCQSNNSNISWSACCDGGVWDKLSVDELLNCMDSLHKVAEEYRSCYGHENKFPSSEKCAMLLTLHAVIHYLAIKIDDSKQHNSQESRLSSYRVPFSLEPLQIEGLVYLDRQTFIRTQEAVNYFESFNSELFVNKKIERPLFADEDSIKINGDKITNSKNETIANTVYWKALLEEQSDLADELNEQGYRQWDAKEQIEFEKNLKKYQEGRLNKKPTKHKNLPQITRQLALLELDLRNLLPSSLWQKEILDKYGYRHVNLLRSITYITQQALHDKLSISDINSFKHCRSNDTLSVDKPGFNNKNGLSKRDTTFSLEKDEHKALAKKAVSGRDMSKWEASTAEGTTLKEIKDQETFLHRLERVFSQRELTPYQLISEISKNIHAVSDPSLQNLLFQVFLRSPYEGKARFFGIGEEVLKDKNFRDLASQLIQKGFNYFKNKQDGLDGARFFLQLSFYFGKFLSDAGQYDDAEKFNLATKMDAWLAQNDVYLTSADRATLHYYRFLFLSLKEELDEQHIADFYASWILSKYLNPGESLNKQWNFPLLKECAQQAIYNVSTMYMDDFQDDKYCASVGSLIAAQLTQFLPQSDSECGMQQAWMIDPILSYPYISQGAYKIDLLGGHLFQNDVSVKSGYDINSLLKENKELQRLFQANEEWSVSEVGNFIQCVNKKETLRIIRNFDLKHQIGNKGAQVKVQRLFPENTWFQLMDEKNRFNFPLALVDDHNIWMHPSEKRGIITRLNSKEPVYTCKDGVIYEICSDSTIDYIDWTSRGNMALTQFEQKENILVFRDKQEVIQKITFPRYRSVEGNELVFQKDGNNFVWTDDKRYILPDKGMQKGFLGTISNYLHLKAADGKSADRLLVPFQKINYEPAHYANGNLDVTNRTSPLPPDLQPKDHEQEGCFNYFFYQIDNGEVIPTSPESKLFLVHLYLTQKKFGPAIELLRSQRYVDKRGLSSISKKILEDIITLPLGEDHPDAKMAAFHALIVIMRDADRCASEKVKVTEYLSKHSLIEEQATRYVKTLQSLNHISASCRLSIDDERHLLENLFQPYFNQKLQDGNLKQDGSHVDSMLSEKILRRLNILKGKNIPEISYTNHSQSKSWKLQALYTDSLYTEGKTGQKTLESCSVDWLTSDAHFNRSKQISRRTANNRGKLSLPENNSLSDTKKYLQQILRPPESVKIEKNGILFQQVYSIAKEGTDAQRREMLFKLNMWRADKKNIFLDLLAGILLKPGNFPTLSEANSAFVSNASLQIKYDFLKQVQNAYTQNLVGTEICEENFESLQLLPQASLGHDQRLNVHYPYATRSAFDSSLQNKGVASKRSLRITIPDSGARWNKLQKWMETYLTKSTNTSEEMHKNFSFVDEGGSSHGKAMQKDLKIQQEDYEKGHALNRKASNLWMIDGTQRADFQSEVDREKEKIQQEARELEKKLLFLANSSDKSMVSPQQQQSTLVRIAIDAPMTVDDCIRCLLSLDYNHYRKKHSHLTDGQIKKLAEMTLQLADLKSEQAHLQRISSLLTNIGKNNSDEKLQKQLCSKIANELKARYYFEEEKHKLGYEGQIAFRVFAGETGMLPFKKQIDLIKKMLESPSSVSQLIMGGGKTSVIALIYLYLKAQQSERIALFTVPPALFDSVEANISEAMRVFQTEVITLKYERSDLTSYKLDEITAILKKAEAENTPIITTLPTIQTFELELLSRLKQLKVEMEKRKKAKQELSVLQASSDQKNIDIAKSNLQKLENNYQITYSSIKALNGIVKKLSEQADGLFDEVDVQLDALQQVNFPSGEKIEVNSDGNLLLQKIYQILASDEKISKQLRLCDNKQASLFKKDSDAYQNSIVPIVASKLVSDVAIIGDYIQDYQQEYIRYVSGKMNPHLQYFSDSSEDLTAADLVGDLKKCDLEELNRDLRFLNYLKKLSKEDPDSSAVKAANLIALSKHFLCDLTPATLKKKGNRHYGISKDENSSGKVTLYLGIDTPSTNEFGYHWEAVAYYYQYAAAFLPEEKQILEIASMAKRAAEYYMEKRGESFTETAEYQDFKKLFGITLDEIHDSNKIKDALQNVSQDIEKRLKIQYMFITNYVSSYHERFSSSGIDAVDLVATCNAMSGTPWNVDGYEEKLASQYTSDKGTEGRILDGLARKANASPILTISDDANSIKQFMQQCFSSHPKPTRLRGLIEAGGVFDKFKSNADVAKGIAEFLAEEQLAGKVDPQMGGVLFFHTDPGQLQPNTLYVWKLGASAPERIGGTTPEALKAKGMNPENYFVFYDEKHTTGTDIAQLPDAINLLTYENTPLQKLNQAIMRMRLFLSGQQEVVFVLSEAENRMLQNGKEAPVSVNDLVLNSTKIQSLKKTEAMVRHFQQQIQHIFRKEAVAQIRKAIESGTDLEQAIDSYLPIIITSLEEKPYQQHAALAVTANTKEMLKEQLNGQLNRFTQYCSQNEVLERVSENARNLSSWIDKSEALPDVWQNARAPIGLEMAVEQQVEVEVEVEVETEVDQEIELELRNYAREAQTIRKEQPMGEENFLHLLYEVRSNDVQRVKTTTLKQQLKNYPYKSGSKFLDYHQVFSDRIYGTDAYFNTCETAALPVFHCMQRPPKQILAIRQSDGDMRWLLLSEHEAGDAKKHLANLYENNPEAVKGVWLIQSDGSLLQQGSEKLVYSAKDRINLLEINAFGGNIEYLERSRQTDSWLAKDTEIKLRFLKVKTARNKEQRQILENLPSIHVQNSSQMNNKILGSFFPGRVEREKNREGTHIPGSPADCKLMDPETDEFTELNSAYIRYLGINWSKRESDKDTEEALQELSISIKSKDKKMLKAAAEDLTKRQFAALYPYQIPHLLADQMAFARLPDDKVKYLKDFRQIYLEDKEGIRRYLLDEKQVQSLDSSQAALIEYVDPELYKKIKIAWQICAIPVGYFEKIESVQGIHSGCWPSVQKEQIKRLSEKLLKQLIERSSSLLTDTQLTHVHGSHLNIIPSGKLKNVCKEQIQEIDNSDLIQQLHVIAQRSDIAPEKWIQWLAPEKIPLIDPKTQLQYLSQEQFAKIPTEWLRDIELKDLYCQWITPEQVPYLSKEQLVTLSQMNRWQELRTNITKEQISTFTSIADMQLLTAEQAAFVDQAQIAGLSEENLVAFATKLEKKTWKVLRTHLEAGQIESITNAQLVNSLSKEKFSYLKSTKAIQNVSYTKVHRLSRQQLRERSWWQFLVYSIGVVTLGVASSIATALAHATLLSSAYRAATGKRLPALTTLGKHTRRLHRYVSVYVKSASVTVREGDELVNL